MAFISRNHSHGFPFPCNRKTDMKEWVQKKKRAEEMGKGPFTILFDKEAEGGVSLPFLVVGGGYGFVPLLGAAVVS